MKNTLESVGEGRDPPVEIRRISVQSDGERLLSADGEGILQCKIPGRVMTLPYQAVQKRKKWGDRGCDRPTACYAKQVCSVELQKD